MYIHGSFPKRRDPNVEPPNTQGVSGLGGSELVKVQTCFGCGLKVQGLGFRVSGSRGLEV